MSREEIRAVVLQCLGDVAPEADLDALQADRPLRDQLDIDSIDFLNFVIELDRSLHVAVPETDYAALATLDRCVDYLTPRVPP
ncbi:MAG TPA: phosphopantetheine-binding protein [Gemmatimonadales bacterium]